MKIKPFLVEQWMNEYEEDAVYNLAETCIDSLTLEELIRLSGEDPEGYLKDLLSKRLTYGHIFGSNDLLDGICSMYKTLEYPNILPTHGAIGANHLAMYSLIEKGDRVISVKPTYQQHYSIPESFGAEVKILKLTPENGFLPNLDELRSLVNVNTKLININNPNNPSGSLMPDEMLKEIVEIARSVDAYILCDEVYRGVKVDGGYMESIADLYEKGISISSMSKEFSLAGLRMGWIATRSQEVLELCREHRDYDTISCGMLDDILAALALKNKEKIFERNREILRKNLAILDEWVETQPHITYTKPAAGTTALLYYDFDIPSREFCIRLMEETGVFFTPGACFELEGCVRIGYAYDSKTLKQGLEKFGEFLKTL